MLVYVLWIVQLEIWNLKFAFVKKKKRRKYYAIYNTAMLFMHFTLNNKSEYYVCKHNSKLKY